MKSIIAATLATMLEFWKSTLAIIAVVVIIVYALATTLPHIRAWMEGPAQAEPVRITQPKGCDVHMNPLTKKMITLTCDNGEPIRIRGDFRNGVDNAYDIEAFGGIRQARVLDGEISVSRVGAIDVDGEPIPAGCVTIQRIDEPKPSRDECSTELLQQWRDDPVVADTEE